MSTPPSLVARLIGIGNYTHWPNLRPEGDINANNLGKFLTEEYIEGDHDIRIIENASKAQIWAELISLRSPYDRSKAIVIFFSGYGGVLNLDDYHSDSIICPADIEDPVKVNQGIRDQDFIQLFWSLSLTRGVNITLLLDAPKSRSFNWGNPPHFVVVAPTKSSENRKAFTNAIIDVLRSEKESLSLLTVQSFAHKMRAFMPDGIEIDCFGANVDCLLFNVPANVRAHYAFTSGRVHSVEKDKSLVIELSAGAAHGVEKGTTYRMYSDHVRTDQECIGHLDVIDKYMAVINATTTTLTLPQNMSVPAVFYVVETGSPRQTVNIFPGDVDTSEIKHTSWFQVDAEDKANIILKRVDGKVEFLWNGFAKAPLPPNVTELCHNLSVTENKQELIRAIRRAARFTYHIESSFDLSSSPFLDVEFNEVNKDSKPSEKNLLDNGVANLKITEGNSPTKFCLVLRNKKEFGIWPYVFVCDPGNFSIRASSHRRQALRR